LQSRDFAHIDNVVQANILAAESKKKFSGDLFNIACGETHSVNEVYAVLDGFFGGTMKKKNAPARLGDPFMSHADISKAKEVLGYKPKVGFLDGLEKTFEWWIDGCEV
jgi:nucleoside-diphosphate-sugar epimerase